MSNTRATHPEIASIIRKRDEIYELINSKQYISASERMEALIRGLRKKDQDKQLINKIRDTVSYIQTQRGVNDYHALGKQNRTMLDLRALFLDYYEAMCELLWKGNYLVDEGYGMVYPANLPKSQAYKSPLLSPLKG